jgi:hypothetical protein
MNIEELRQQLEDLAGPEMRANSAARDAVRGRVRRARRRNGTRAAIASVVVVAVVVGLIGVGLRGGSDRSAVKVRTVPSTGDAALPLQIGTVSGVLEAVGGPAPGSPRPLVGSFRIVTATTRSPAGSELLAQCLPVPFYKPCLAASPVTGATKSDGTFVVDLPVGRYTVTGTSPMYESGSAACQGGTIVVTREHTTKVAILCEER